VADSADNREDQAEGGDRFGCPLAEAAARLHRQLQRRQVEHQVRSPGAEDAEAELDEDIGAGIRP